MSTSFIARWVALAVLFVSTGSWSYAQTTGSAAADSSADRTSRHSVSLRGVSLPLALERFAALTQASMAYDADLVRGRQTFCAIQNAPTRAVLSCILRSTGLDYVRTSNGTFIIVPSAQQEAKYGQIAGIVVDASTGEPLPGANILFAEASAGTSTNDAGLFQVSSLLDGPHQIVVSYIGYETATANVVVESGERKKRRIELVPRPVVSEPLIVDGLQPRLPSQTLGKGVVSPGTLREPSAQLGTGDITRAAGTLIGVSTQSPLANLHIQGGDVGEHEMQLDGVPVRNPVSAGRLIGAFSPMAIGRLKTQKAGFGAMDGSHLSGVVQLEHDLTQRGTRWASLSADPVSTNARVQGTVSLGGRPVTAMSTARIGMWSVYQDPALHRIINNWSAIDPVLMEAWTYRPQTQTTAGEEVAALNPASMSTQNLQPTAQFSDWHAALRAELSPYRFLYVSGYHGRSTIGSDLLIDEQILVDRDTVSVQAPTYDRYEWDNTTAQARLEWLMGARTIGEAQVYMSHYSAASAYTVGQAALPGGEAMQNEIAPGAARLMRPDDHNRITEIGARVRFDIGITARQKVDVELDVEHLQSDFQVANAFIPTLRHDLNATQAAIATNSEVSLGGRTTIETGIRLTYLDAQSTVYAEPRIALRYDVAESGVGGYAFRLAGGVYRQFTNQFNISRDGATAVVPTASVWLPADHSLAPPRAYHVSAEALWTPADRWRVNLETYAKLQPHLLAIDYPSLRAGGVAPPSGDASSQKDFIAHSRGRAAGAGLRVEYVAERFDASVAYNASLSERSFPGRFGGRLVSTPWNEPHRVDLSADLAIGGGFSVQTNLSGIWGRAWGYRNAYYDYLSPSPGVPTVTNGNVAYRHVEAFYAKHGRPDLTRPEADRLPPLIRLDAGIGYNRRFSDVEIGALLQVADLLDRRNVVDRSLLPVDGSYETRPRTLPGRLPTVSLTVSY